ncbi:MAG: hypothetical protein ABI601_07100 [bacterium]
MSFLRMLAVVSKLCCAPMIALSAMCFPLAGVTSAQPLSDALSRHRSVYRTIEQNLRRYRHVETDMDTLGLEPRSTEGGRLGAYCDGNTIRLLVAEYYGETGDVSERFYFDRDSLLFVFRQRRRGIPDDKNPYPRRTIFEDERFYFVRDRLARWLGPTNRRRSVSSSAAREETRSLVNDAHRFRAAMPACQPTYANP